MVTSPSELVLTQNATGISPSIKKESLSKPPDRRLLYISAGFIAALLLISAHGHVPGWLTPHTPVLLDQSQLTDNGHEKNGIVTGDGTVYFGQEQNGWFALAEMSVDGGPVHVKWNPSENVLPVDVSPDGKKLLALCGKGVEEERELWLVPLGGGEPQRLADITAHSAAWAPDGRTIAYSSGTDIYLTSIERGVSEKIGSFARVPRALHWSNDHRYIRFVLDGLFIGKGVLSGQISDDPARTITIRQFPSSIDWNRDWNTLRELDTYYAWKGSNDSKQPQVLLVNYGNRWWQPSIETESVPFIRGELSGLAFARQKSRILVLAKPKDRVSFVRFDAHSRDFQQILTGASGMYLNYSRDGKWITYVSYREDSLWMSRTDGSDARQLTFPPEIVELPRWSPDGKQIAYMSLRSGGPWRIRILDVKTGKTRDAATSNDSQGAPTWSPDGKTIAYGNVNCEELQSCAIRQIDLGSGKVRSLPSSEGLFTARWSPDGHSIAALNLEQHQLMLFDVNTRRWKKLADGVCGTDLGWTSDSKFLYIDVPGEARIVRIRAADGQQETVLDLRSQHSFNLADTEDLQFTMAPDDSVILHRQIHSPELYAYDIRNN